MWYNLLYFLAAWFFASIFFTLGMILGIGLTQGQLKDNPDD